MQRETEAQREELTPEPTKRDNIQSYYLFKHRFVCRDKYICINAYHTMQFEESIPRLTEEKRKKKSFGYLFYIGKIS